MEEKLVKCTLPVDVTPQAPGGFARQGEPQEAQVEKLPADNH